MSDPTAMPRMLGKQAAKLIKGLPALGKYTLTLPQAPPEANYGLALKNLGVMANDSLGDCTCASCGHAIQTWTSLTKPTEVVVPDATIIDLYAKSCGYNPGDPLSDNGGVLSDVLKYWYQNGIGGHPLSGFAGIRPGNRASIRDAIYLFGVASVGVQLPLAAQYQDVWDVKPDAVMGGDNAPGSWGGHAVCLVGDTPIPLLNGTEKAIKDIPTDSDSWVYSSSAGGRIVPGRARSLGCTGRGKELYRVTLDNGQSVRSTGEHLFMMRDGSYRPAIELKAGDSLMPLYRKVANNKANPGYEMCLNNETHRWSFTHHLIASDRRPELNGLVVHHDDFNKKNNEPDNLIPMTWEDHTALHALYTRPEALIPYVKSKEGRERSRQNMQALWDNPEWRAKALMRASENGKKVSAKLKAEGRLGTQAFDKTKLRALGLASAKNLRPLTKAEAQRRIAAFREMVNNDPVLKQKMDVIARDNIKKAHEKSNNNGLTLAQLSARSMNAKKLCYHRWHKDLYSSFEAYEQARNHKVVSVERDGHGDVYDLTVEKYHNFAVSAGVFLHNCLVAYDQDTLTCITWGALKKMSWNWLDAYCDEAYGLLSKDWLQASGNAPPGFDFDILAADMQAIKAGG